MPEVKCQCGAITNSALSKYWLRKNQEVDLADGCYAKWMNDHYEEGCLFATTPDREFMKEFARKIIKKGKYNE